MAVALGRKPHVAGYIGTQELYTPVRAVCQAVQRAVIAEKIYLLPSGLETSYHIEALGGKEHSLYPVQPCGAFLMIYSLFRSRSGIYPV